MANRLAHDLKSHERTSDVRLKDVVPFKRMLLRVPIQRGLELSHFVYPTYIQATAIPLAIAGIDLLIQSKSGTGKTLIFTITALQLYNRGSAPNVLIVAPTREIAIQIEDTLNGIGEHCHNFKAVSCIGGVDVTADRRRIQDAKVVVGTPGRLSHLIENNVLNTSQIKLFVLDEADKLFTGSFREDVQQILSALPLPHQTIACSATYPNKLDHEIAKIMNKPLLISNSNRDSLLVGIRQFVFKVPSCKNSMLEIRSKLNAVRNIFEQLSFKQCLIFASTQTRADSYCNYLQKEGWPCELITGAQDQALRVRNFKKFRKFETRIMVTTDLMARGVDSEYVNLVINLELPHDVVTYLHRIGRAGRFGAHGLAITMIDDKQHDKFRRLLAGIGTSMNIYTFPQSQQKEMDFWNFEKNSFPIFMEAKTMLNSEHENEVALPNELNIETSEDTQNYCVNTYNSENGIADDASKAATYIVAESLQSSTQQQGRCNTIDDASSLKSDSSPQLAKVAIDNAEKVKIQPVIKKLAPKTNQTIMNTKNQTEVAIPLNLKDEKLETEGDTNLKELYAVDGRKSIDEGDNKKCPDVTPCEDVAIANDCLRVDLNQFSQTVIKNSNPDVELSLFKNRLKLNEIEFSQILLEVLKAVTNVNNHSFTEEKVKTSFKMINFGCLTRLTESTLIEIKEKFQAVRCEETERKILLIQALKKLFRDEIGSTSEMNTVSLNQVNNNWNQVEFQAKSDESAQNMHTQLKELKLLTKFDLLRVVIIKIVENKKLIYNELNSFEKLEEYKILMSEEKAKIYKNINERLIKPIDLGDIFDNNLVLHSESSIPDSLVLPIKEAAQQKFNIDAEIPLQLPTNSPDALAIERDSDHSREPLSADTQSPYEIQTTTASSGFDEHTSSVSSGIDNSQYDTTTGSVTISNPNSSYPSTSEAEDDCEENDNIENCTDSEEGERQINNNGSDIKLENKKWNIEYRERVKRVLCDLRNNDINFDNIECVIDRSADNNCSLSDTSCTQQSITAQEYSEAYAKWIDIYWSQRNYVQEYVKLASNFQGKF